MHEHHFCNWVAWSDRKAIVGSGFPGVYAIARSKRDIAGTHFEWLRQIFYVGMTNGVSGLRGRLNQFDATIRGMPTRHGGADRVRMKHSNFEALAATLFVSVAAFKCDPASNAPRDLRQMGEVAKLEFACLAEYAERFGRVPEFNDKKNAPKFSKA